MAHCRSSRSTSARSPRASTCMNNSPQGGVALMGELLWHKWRHCVHLTEPGGKWEWGIRCCNVIWCQCQNKLGNSSTHINGGPIRGDVGYGGSACADGEVRHHKRSSGHGTIRWIEVGHFPWRKIWILY